MGSCNILKKISKEDEASIRYLLENYTAEELLSESKIGRKILPYLGAGLMAMSSCSIDPKINSEKDPTEIVSDTLTNNANKLIDDRIEAATKYIDANLKRNGKSIEDVPFDIADLVIACYENDFDLPLAMAQLQIESHFGTDGDRQRKTKSLFSVGLYDSGTNKKYYNTYRESIDDYIDKMQEHYLQNGKISVSKLLMNFVDDQGHRYAQDPNYERSIISTRNKIIKTYPILAN